MDSLNYNEMELMICVASRVFEDGASVSVGTGVPCAAAMLSQKLYAPNLLITFEAGSVAPLLPSMPLSVGDSTTMRKAIQTTSTADAMEMLQRGLIDYCFLGGAQIDMYGNLNSTVIGDYRKPSVRFPGSGGANDFASMSWRTIVVTPQSKRRFTNNIDFITTPGYLTGPGERERAGLPKGTGPYKVITNMAVLGFDDKTKRMMVESVHPGYTLDDVRNNTDFELLVAEDITQTKPPTEEELYILRNEVDPFRAVIGKKAQ
ncbi:CoA-transferase subunit beta [Hippea sp. KM1]|uniref:CoA-transferase subunit beta n=1 Tax=Hippea sp. KM1 TaxID=944481 RepID=UPI00046CFAD1|nr:CoA-transferase [Hippea sp. KM1]